MADYIELTDAETAFKKPIRQALMRKMKDNFVNHEARLVELEAGTIAFSHWGERGDSTQNARSFPSGDWSYAGHDGSIFDEFRGNDIKPYYSVGRMNTNATSWPTLFGSGRYSICVSNLRFQFDNVIKPIFYRGRFRMSNTNDAIKIGLWSPGGYNPLLPNQTGCYLEKVDSSNWRFLSQHLGSRTLGSPFTKPTNNLWFDVEIEFTDTPIDKAICRVNGSQVADIQADLPVDVNMCHAFMVDWSVPNWLDVDWAEFRSGDYSLAP